MIELRKIPEPYSLSRVCKLSLNEIWRHARLPIYCLLGYFVLPCSECGRLFSGGESEWGSDKVHSVITCSRMDCLVRVQEKNDDFRGNYHD